MEDAIAFANPFPPTTAQKMGTWPMRIGQVPLKDGLIYAVINSAFALSGSSFAN
jgi:hypothetical protein